MAHQYHLRSDSVKDLLSGAPVTQAATPTTGVSGVSTPVCTTVTVTTTSPPLSTILSTPVYRGARRKEAIKDPVAATQLSAASTPVFKEEAGQPSDGNMKDVLVMMMRLDEMRRREEERKESRRLKEEERKESMRLKEEERKESMRLKEEERKESMRLKEEEGKERRWKEQMELHRQEMETRKKEMETLKEELSQSRQRADSNTGSSRLRPPRIVLPVLKPGEDIDVFLEHFEKMANIHNLTDDEKLIHLSSSLTGKAKEACFKLGDNQTYAHLQSILRAQFRLTADSYRRKFRNAKKDPHETYYNFGDRLRTAFDHWLELSGADIKDLILIEQLYNGCNPDLKIRMSEQQPTTFDQAINIAEIYAEARRTVRGPGDRDVRAFPKPNVEQEKSAKPTQETGGGNKSASNIPAARRADLTCYYCGQEGHTKRRCPKLPPYYRQGPHSAEGQFAHMPHDTGCAVFLSKVGEHLADSIRDTGASTVFIDESLVPDDSPVGQSCYVTGIDKEFVCKRYNVLVDMCTPYFTGKVWAVAVKDPMYSILLGNNVTCEDGSVKPVSSRLPEQVYGAVATRSMMRKEPALEPIARPELDRFANEVNPQVLRRLQLRDPKLDHFRELTGFPPKINKHGSSVSFEEKNGILYRHYKNDDIDARQVIVPKPLIPTVLKVAHDAPMAGHMGVERTKERVRQDFYWPCMHKDIKLHCKTCDVCQRTTPKGYNYKVPLGSVPIVTEPFEKVGVDLVGPISPPSSKGHKYILVQVDYATRYPEAAPLRNIEANTVAETLWTFWTRTGIPKVVHSDQGTQFVSGVMQRVHQLLSIKGQVTSPYHAQANGLVEKFNGTLKLMLKRLCRDRPRDWDKLIPAVLFAYREIPQESMRFSPFELLYGRTVRGPSSVLKQLWTDGEMDTDGREECDHVIHLRNTIADVCELAHENLAQAAAKYKKVYDKKTRDRQFQEGDEVLLLLPLKKNKMQVEWQGPFKVIQRVGECDYRIKIRGRTRLYHANLLKPYYRRECAQAAITPMVVEETSDAESVMGTDIPVIPIKSTETWKDVVISPELNTHQKREATELCKEFGDILTDMPLRSTIGSCNLPLAHNQPIRVKQYPLPHSQADVVSEEVKAMLDMGVIERTSSPYSAPVLLVKKSDGRMRFCIDFRRLNKVLTFDAEPMPDIESMFANLHGAKFFSKLDLAKGYWQIPMDPADKSKTAFTTPSGQFQFTVMPFGLKTAGAIFSRIMREVLGPLKLREAQNFMDDLIIATAEWKRHLDVLAKIFLRLREVHLAARPSKCEIGRSEIAFLGHMVREGKILPQQEKITKVLEARPPETKKELRSFLGLVGYYRKFIPSFAEIALPLTDQTKGRLRRIEWNTDCQKSFEALKQKLTSSPVLLIADPSKQFVLRTDASTVGIGAALMQDQGEGLQPVAYASKKLSGAETRYHTIELECLAVVWALRKFYPFLYGREFVLQCDHHPLQYLERIRPVSKRLMGWAMELQSTPFIFQHLAGTKNIEADYLSRLPHRVD